MCIIVNFLSNDTRKDPMSVRHATLSVSLQQNRHTTEKHAIPLELEVLPSEGTLNTQLKSFDIFFLCQSGQTFPRKSLHLTPFESKASIHTHTTIKLTKTQFYF